MELRRITHPIGLPTAADRRRRVSILAKSLCREMRLNDFESGDMVALATEIIGLVTEDMRHHPEKDAAVEERAKPALVCLDAISDHLVALVMSRYDITAPQESMFGATDASLRDLISRDKEDELHSRILEKYRALEHECDFVVCAGTIEVEAGDAITAATVHLGK